MSPITELRLYLRLRPYIAALQKEFKMKLSTNMIIQVLGTVVQVLNQVSTFLNPKERDTLAAVVGIIQAVAALMGHLSNPDGTPANQPYKGAN